MVLVKAKLGDDVRRVEIEETDFKTLKRTLRRLFAQSLPAESDLSIKYLDDEGDAVSLTCDKELQEALHFIVPANPRPFLRLTLSVVASKPAAPRVATPVAAPTPSPAVPSAPASRCPHLRQQQQQQSQQPPQSPFGAGFPFDLLRGVPFGLSFASTQQQPQQQPQQPRQQSAVGGINDAVASLLEHPEIRQLAESFGVKPDAVPGQVDSLLRAFLPPSAFAPQQPSQQQQEEKGKEKEKKESLPETINSLFAIPEVGQLAAMFGLKPEQLASDVNSFLRDVLPPEVLDQVSKPEKEEAEPKKANTEDETKPVVHHAFCDRCSKQIVGVRFKCGMCADYDLCEPCEALMGTDSSIHDPLHLFIKVRTPTYLGTVPIIDGFIEKVPCSNAPRACAGWGRRRGCGKWHQRNVRLQQQAGDQEPEVAETTQPEPVKEEVAVVAEPIEAVVEPVVEAPQPTTPEKETVLIEELDEKEETVVKVTPLVRLIAVPIPAATPAPVPEQPVVVEEPKPVVVEPVVVVPEKKEEDKFAIQLEQLAAMGFNNTISNRIALYQANGDLIAAVNILLGA